MGEKQMVTMKSLGVIGDKILEITKPLEQLSHKEVERRQCIGRIMTHVLKYITCEFVNRDFEWLLPVIFSKSTDPLWPDSNASIEKRIEVEIYEEKVKATLSMIVHKMVACSLAYPKLFILSPNVRIERRERANGGMHAFEFTQLDFEVRNATSEDIRRFVEGIICGLIGSLKREMKDELLYLGRYHKLRIIENSFRIYSAEELENERGREWEAKMLSEMNAPVWVTNIPREFYDFEDFESGKWDNYDLLLPKYGEVLSGSRREVEYNKIVGKMERDGIRKENYGILLKLAKERKLKPSAGAGIGLERLVSWIVGAKHIAETQLFPKIPGIIYDL